MTATAIMATGMGMITGMNTGTIMAMQHEHAHHDHGAKPVAVGIPAMRAERADPPRLSLMALSASQRLMLVTPVIAALWLLTIWALRDG